MFEWIAIQFYSFQFPQCILILLQIVKYYEIAQIAQLVEQRHYIVET